MQLIKATYLWINSGKEWHSFPPFIVFLPFSFSLSLCFLLSLSPFFHSSVSFLPFFEQWFTELQLCAETMLITLFGEVKRQFLPSRSNRRDKSEKQP